MASSRVHPGDVLLNITGASIGRVCVVPDEICPTNVNQHVSIVRCKDDFLPNFIAYYISSPEFQEHIFTSEAGATRQALTKALIEDFRVPLPPLPEQRRIAAILAAGMAEVERARAAAQAQLEAAKNLPAAFLRDVFPKPGEVLPEGWRRLKLGDIAQVVSGVTLGRKINGDEVMAVPYLRVANVKDGRLDLQDVKQTFATVKEITTFKLQRGDLLLTEGGDPDKLGRGTYWQSELPLCIHQNHIFRVRFDPAFIQPEFAAAQFGSSYGKAYFLAHAKQTTGIATINKQVVNGFPFLAPPLSEQHRIIGMFKTFTAEADRTETAAQAQLDAIAALPSSLLRQAFNGEL